MSTPKTEQLPVSPGDTPPEDQVMDMATPDDLAEAADQSEEETA
ncbi:hypothetical protein [Streptomyces sp. NPDC088348]